MHVWCTPLSTAIDNSQGSGVLRRSESAALAGSEGLLTPPPLQLWICLGRCLTAGVCMCLVPLKVLVPSIWARFGELSSPREIAGELAVAAVWAWRVWRPARVLSCGLPRVADATGARFQILLQFFQGAGLHAWCRELLCDWPKICRRVCKALSSCPSCLYL